MGCLAQLAYWKDHIGNVSLMDIDRDTIMDELDRLAKEPARQPKRGKASTDTGRPRSPATVNRYLAALSSAFQSGIKGRMVKENPCRGIPRGKETHRFGRSLSDDERKALLAACKDSEWDRLYLLVTMALSTGARVGELFSLSWDDLDLRTSVAKLRDTKNGSPRHLPLISAVLEQIQALPRPIDGAVLLFSAGRDPRTPYDFRKHWNTAKRIAGIDNFRFHDLRHSAASYLTEAGVPLVTVAEILGHKTMSMVQRYSHVATEHKRKVLEDTFNDILG